MNYNIEYGIGDYVYLKTDPDQVTFIVTGICLRNEGATYELSSGLSTTWHYKVELSKQRDIVKATSN